MNLFPAIDLYHGQAVRLFKGDYDRMTVYDPDPLNTALAFEAAGAGNLHRVDLEGARDGGTPNADTIRRIVKGTGLFVELGGGIRSMDVIDRYLSLGVRRVILGTAAITGGDLVERAVAKYGDAIAVGADVRDGLIAIKGWTEQSDMTLDRFMERFQRIGVRTVICTDISRDGAMRGANRAMYAAMQRAYDMDIIASGGVSTLEDIRALADMGLYGAIIGKAYYTGAIDLKEAIREATA
ncbi:MAG: 1-(5-phosphoribosyl)-5-[Clostridia bacterium]|nr:1-(5-phosphoribosyl)-5-[(5-phosphoribosylamino)methylideneamino]imidazole-4-carboxamide isomerase [Clostridia bacterium]